ncbi:NAD(P)H-dependent oxidoreductase, partial [Streptomyces sp. NPDC005921]
MATVLSVSGSPSATSRTARLLRHLDRRLAAQGHEVIPLDVRTLPAQALLGADFAHPAVVEAAALFERARTSVTVGVCATLGVALLGSVLGGLAGFFGG